MPSSASKLHTQPFITKLPTRRSSDLDCEESILAGAGRQPRVTQGLLRNSLWTLRSLLSSLFILPDSSVPSLPPLTNKVANLRWRLVRSEEHTSELQSLRHLVCRLLLQNFTLNLLSPSYLHDALPISIARNPSSQERDASRE